MSVTVSAAQFAEDKESESLWRDAVERALLPLGGLKDYVRPGNRVLLKPNQTLFKAEKSGSTTSPQLMRVLTRMCREAGAKDVWVAEASGHAQLTREVMAKTGMPAACQEAGATMIYLDEIAEDVYDFGEDAGDLRIMPAPEIMTRADVIINVPKAKTHFVDPISGACKNWVGVIPMSYRLTLQRRVEAYYRGTALFLRKFRPTLTVFDGAWAGEGQGPGSNDAFWWGWTLVSTDPVAADITLARLFDLPYEHIRMANTAASFGVGENDVAKIDFSDEQFARAHHPVKPAERSVHRYPCNVIVGEGPGATMEGTLGHWRTIADAWLSVGLWKLFNTRGRPTFMFGAADDPDFEAHLKQGPYIVLDDAAKDEYKRHPGVIFVPGSPVPQSYIQNEMVAAMGFGGIYHMGLSAEKVLQTIKGKFQATG